MPKHAAVTKQADSKGRITLGGAYANRTMIVEQGEDEIILRLARVIPEREAWLYENEQALNSVRKGLDQARKGKFAKAPDLTALERLANKLVEN